MSDSPETVRETLERVFDEAERAAPPPPRPIARQEPRESRRNSPEATERPPARSNGAETRPNRAERETEAPEPVETEPETAPEASESGANRPRDQFGRFTSATPEARAERPEQEAAPEPDETDEPSSTDQPEPDAAEQDAGPAILPPRAWSAAAKAEWHQLPRAIQEEVDRREREVSRTFQQRAEQTNVLQPIAEAIQPYAQKLALRGMNPAAAVGQLLAVQDILERDPMGGVAYVAKQYGVDLRNFAAAHQQAQQPQDPVVQQHMQQLTQRVTQLDQVLNSWQQAAHQQQQATIEAEVRQFAANTREYPYFEHVRPRMAELMASGGATSLAQAYRLACADNDEIAAAIAHAQRSAETSQRTQAAKQAADRARKAAVSVSGSPYGGGGGQRTNGKARTLRDELSETYDELAGR